MTDDEMNAPGARAAAIRKRIEALLGDHAAPPKERHEVARRVNRRIRKLLRRPRKARKAA